MSARRFGIHTLLAGCLLASSAAAQEQGTDVATARARDLFSRGAALAKESRWADALAAFEQSRLLRTHASTTYDIGYCERALGHATRARKAFSQALDEARRRPGELDEAQRADAETYRAEAKKLLGTGHVRVDAIGASITVDGRPLELDAGVAVAGTREPGPGDPTPSADFDVLVDPGSHVFTITDASGTSATVAERFSAGSERSVALTMTRAPKASAPRERNRATDAGGVTDLGARRTWALGLGAAGAVSLVASGVFALSARSAWSDAKAVCPTQTACPDDRGATLSHDARTRANLASVSLVVSASALAGATVLWLTSSDGVVGAGVMAAPGSVSIAARGSF